MRYVLNLQDYDCDMFKHIYYMSLYAVADDSIIGNTKERFCKQLEKILGEGKISPDIFELRSVFRAAFCPQRKEYQFIWNFSLMDTSNY